MNLGTARLRVVSALVLGVVCACANEEGGSPQATVPAPTKHASDERYTAGARSGAKPGSAGEQAPPQPSKQAQPAPAVPLGRHEFDLRVFTAGAWRQTVPADEAAFLKCERALAMAQAAAIRGDQETEIQLLNQAAAACPEHRRARYARGLTFMRLRNLKAAIEDFRSAIEIDPLAGDAYDDLALAYYHSGDTPRALATLADGVRVDEKLLTWYGDSYLGVRDPETAILQHRDVLAKNPRDVVILYRSAIASRSLAPEQRDAAVSRLLDAAPDFVPALMIGFDLSPNRTEGTSLLLRAAKLEPRNPFVARRAAELALGLGHYEAAVNSAAVAIEVRPDIGRHHVLHGLALFALGRVTEGMRSFDRSVDAEPTQLPSETGVRLDKHMELWFRLIDWGSKEQRLALASLLSIVCGQYGVWQDQFFWDHRDDFRKLPTLVPSFRTGHMELALALRGTAAALEAWSTALDIAPSARAYNERAVIAMNSGRHADALADLDRALRLAPLFRRPYNNRGVIFWDQGDRALVEFLKSAYVSPDEPEDLLRRNLVDLLTARGEVEWAGLLSR